jgi:hypothetical protein
MNNIEYITDRQLHNLLHNHNKKPIHLQHYFTSKTLIELKLNLTPGDNMLFFNSCLGGDLSLLPEIVEIMSNYNYIGIVKNYVSSLHLAILGLCNKILIFKDSLLSYHPIKPYPDYSEIENNKLISLYADCTKFLNSVNSKHLIC